MAKATKATALGVTFQITFTSKISYKNPLGQKYPNLSILISTGLTRALSCLSVWLLQSQSNKFNFKQKPIVSEWRALSLIRNP